MLVDRELRCWSRLSPEVAALPIEADCEYSVTCTDEQVIFTDFQHRLPCSVQPVRCRVGANERDERTPQLPRYPGIDLSAHGSCAHRSISPSTMSIEPITATTSASRRPAHILSTACRVAK